MSLTGELGGGGETSADCRCDPAFAEDRLVIDASDCPGDGRLAAVPDCRASTVEALVTQGVATVVVETTDVERAYDDDAAALLVAAGRFVSALRPPGHELAERALTDPIGAGRAASGRRGPARSIAVETGLVELALRADGYESALSPTVSGRPEI